MIERVLPLSDTKSYCTLASVVFSSGKGNALAVAPSCSKKILQSTTGQTRAAVVCFAHTHYVPACDAPGPASVGASGCIPVDSS